MFLSFLESWSLLFACQKLELHNHTLNQDIEVILKMMALFAKQLQRHANLWVFKLSLFLFTNICSSVLIFRANYVNIVLYTECVYSGAHEVDGGE